MTSSLTINSYKSDDQKHLLDNYHYLTERRCLKQRLYHAPLALRRSISLEDSSTDTDNNLLDKKTDKYSLNLIQTQSSQLSSSLNSLCLKLRRYQLLPEYDEDIAKSSDENNFNWWITAARLKPIFQKIVMSDYKNFDHFPETYGNDQDITFKDCKRQQRRNAVCLEVDRLYYNDQLILFAMVANEVQLEFNLTFSGFTE
ncbi:unnamed protein product [Rotaria socialis]|uniref:Uncharacterized protein n=1 Tax=Rotaria socialis TaxID=392032 RepID=A0A820YEA7_9BILA|nr:unnamed protein product [Rotaria socialis]CAF3486870.1 unnamed protein product [Rotaria socialis]CAF3547938.1 unnamed protein product [Rotaria socialis]CAF3569666.1 unnamed protein product [Rotaria socialis]CAF3746914.1 unnamed protein product [Rotaria socialis]